MAPVFLVSGTNAVPDDSSLITLPRTQVDYLSHDWQEEDVWRSWRNMTRQKNDIANGIRLENASWRTWWKQRNKLKTVTPETLNWLKDSDVTWLYGPLHTAVEWNPPPKSKSTTVVSRANSAHDLLDLNITKKPILKHRSISELLTSDLPSPMFSPAESDADEMDLSTIQETLEEDKFCALEQKMNEEHEKARSNQRPSLPHTKSDTHIARWNSNRPFRADSPPHIIASEHGKGQLSQSLAQPCVNSRHPPPLKLPPFGNSYSTRDTSSSTSTATFDDRGNGDLDVTPTPSAGLPSAGKRRHISFNTFVEQCIAIEKPKKSSSSAKGWKGVSGFDVDEPYDEGYDEDEEDGYADEGLPVWAEPEHAIVSDSDSDGQYEVEDDVLEMHTSLHRFKSKPHTNGRSQSKASSSSSSSTSSTGFRPALMRLPSSDKEHFTIAPIAPTILKTTGVGNGHGWVDGLGDDFSDDGVSAGWYIGQTGKGGIGNGRKGSMPVELVYVPPLGSNYSVKRGEAEGEAEDVYHHKEAYFSTGGLASPAMGIVPSVGVTPASPPGVKGYGEGSPGSLTASLPVGRKSEPDAYDYFGGPDLGEDFTRVPQSGRRREAVDDEDAARDGRGMMQTRGRSGSMPELLVNDMAERSRPRSKSRSRSRTPSPAAFHPSSPSVPPSSPAVAIPVTRGRDLSNSPPSALLSPPLRGRSSLSSPTRESRGRSSTRGSSASVSRERSSHGSPLGSLSPDGSAVGLGVGVGIRSVYYGGRVERGRDKGRRCSENLGHSLSPEDVGARAVAESVGMGTGGGRIVPGTSSPPSSTVSSSSTVTPAVSSIAIETSAPIAPRRHISTAIERDVDEFSRHPTTSNPPGLTILTANSAPPPNQPFASSAVPVPESPHSPSSPTIKGRLSADNADPEGGTIVGRAVGIVSSAGAYLGFWQSTQGGVA